jgi:hypothetical protein
MADSDWRTTLQAVAPLVATAIGGPLAGVAATVVGRTLLGRGEDMPTTVAEAQEAITRAVATPEGLAKLREAEAKLQELSNQLAIRLEEISASDRAGARDMAKDDRWTPRILAFAVVVGWLGLNAAVLIWGLPPGSGEIAARAMGGLDALLLIVYQFFFGSSVGSRQKTDALAAAARR